MSDPLGDMLTRIRNGQRALKPAVDSPASRLRSNVLEVLRREGYIRGYSQFEMRLGISELRIELKYHEGDPVIRPAHIISVCVAVTRPILRARWPRRSDGSHQPAHTRLI